MEALPVVNLPARHEKIEQAAVKLGEILFEQPLYQAYLQSIKDLLSDPQVKEISSQIQTARNGLFSGKHPEQADELQRLELQLEDLPMITAYRAAEDQVRGLMRSVNALLSKALKVDFAANAKRG